MVHQIRVFAEYVGMISLILGLLIFIVWEESRKRRPLMGGWKWIPLLDRPKFPPEGLTQSQNDLAWEWQIEHHDLVARLLRGETSCFPPSGSDKLNPAVWKPGHWSWWYKANGV